MNFDRHSPPPPVQNVSPLMRNKKLRTIPHKLLGRRGVNGLRWIHAAVEEHIAVWHSISYDEDGSKEHLDRSIERWLKRISLTPETQAALHLESLGDLYEDRYNLSGAMRDLDEAIHQYKKALELNPIMANIRRPLAFAHWRRYLRLRETADLEMAIKNFEEALDTGTKHPSLPKSLWFILGPMPKYKRRNIFNLQVLGMAYMERHETTGSIEDLDKAFQLFEECLNLLPSQKSYSVNVLPGTNNTEVAHIF